jgi:Asp-tRNA(Asn)/Glu-tRNA(Gln) amidotransferase B subunit
MGFLSLAKFKQIGTLLELAKSVEDGKISEEEAKSLVAKVYPDLPQNWLSTATVGELNDVIEKGYKAAESIPDWIAFYHSMQALTV